ncbi:MAG: putative PEP-CTERM system histidine kinase [Paraglaciecola sp.]|jgi:putative PEP-CTERM system histidine kinase
MMAVWGYAVSAAGYALLLLLLLTVRKSGLAKYLLILATAATFLWSLSPFILGTMSAQELIFFDNIKQIFWLLFLASCLKDNFTNLIQVLRRKETWLILFLPALGVILPLFSGIPLNWLYMLQTLIALQVLVILEQMYRQAGDSRWALKPLVLYLGAINLFEFVTFANALMVEQIDMTYIAARGFIYSALIPLLVLAIRRAKQWGVEIYISRDVVLHSSLLLVAGGYLCVMALIGYGVKYYGGEWDTRVQVVLIFLSLALLVTVFLSNSFRTKIRVFITKHFFANQFDYRQEWLKLTRSLESNNNTHGNVYLTALEGFLKAIDYQSGFLIQIDNGNIKHLAEVDFSGLSDGEIDIVIALGRYCKQKNWIVDIEELRTKPSVYEGLKVNHALLNQASFQLIVPIYREDKFWGIAGLKGSENTGKTLNWELRDYLTAVTAQIANFLFHHEAAEELAENAQFAAFTRMSAFVLHDLKNVLAQIDLILCNSEQHKDNPEFIDDTFETLHHTKARMEKMLYQLTDKNAPQYSSQRLCTLSKCIQQVVGERCAGQLPKPKIHIFSETDVVLEQDKFSNVLYHIISNAQQATADDGNVDISVEQSIDERYMLVIISDDGVGMSSEFIQNRLFKPFDTTKGNAGMGIGAYDAKAFLEKIGGQLQVKSSENEGSTFTMYIPAN